jgi:hypothetical protein
LCIKLLKPLVLKQKKEQKRAAEGRKRRERKTLGEKEGERKGDYNKTKKNKNEEKGREM